MLPYTDSVAIIAATLAGTSNAGARGAPVVTPMERPPLAIWSKSLLKPDGQHPFSIRIRWNVRELTRVVERKDSVNRIIEVVHE
jgi:hypothetical protein